MTTETTEALEPKTISALIGDPNAFGEYMDAKDAFLEKLEETADARQSRYALALLEKQMAWVA